MLTRRIERRRPPPAVRFSCSAVVVCRRLRRTGGDRVGCVEVAGPSTRWSARQKAAVSPRTSLATKGQRCPGPWPSATSRLRALRGVRSALSSGCGPSSTTALCGRHTFELHRPPAAQNAGQHALRDLNAAQALLEYLAAPSTTGLRSDDPASTERREPEADASTRRRRSQHRSLCE